MSGTQKPSTLVIFGATGDLTQRKLIPALFNQYVKGYLPEPFTMVGFAFEDYTTDTLRQRFLDGMREFSKKSFDEAKWSTFCSRLHYVQGNLTAKEDFERLEEFLREVK